MPKPITPADIAIFQAMTRYGNETASIVSALTQKTTHIFKPLLHGEKITHQSKLYERHHRDVNGFNFIVDGKPTGTWAFAGLVSERAFDFAVWIETHPDARHKEIFRQKLKTLLDTEENDDADPKMRYVDSYDSKYWDIEMRLPADSILDKPDQSEWLINFVDKGIIELLELDIREVLKDAMREC